MFYVWVIVNSFLLWSAFCPVNGEVNDEVAKDIRSRLENSYGSAGFKKDPFADLNRCLDQLDKGIKEREELIKRMKVRMDKIWVTNKPQHIETKVIIKGNVKVGKLTVTKKVILTEPIKSVNPVETEKRFVRASKQVAELVEMVEHKVVRKDRAEQKIDGTIHFLHPIRADKIIIESIRPSTLINGISFHELRTNVLRKSGNQTVTGNWTFHNIHIGADRMTVNGLVNRLNLSDVLLINSPMEQVVKGDLTIRDATFNNLQFDSINGIKQSELIFKGHISKPIVGNKIFKRVLKADGIDLTGHLNGYNWTHLIKNSINIHRPTVKPIPVSLRFDTVPQIKDLKTRSVNNMRVDNLKEGLTLEELKELSGRKIFRSLSASKVILSGKLNGLSVPNDLVSLRSLQNLQEPITFEGRITFNSNLTVGKINDVDIVRDAVRRSSPEPQIIHGTKVFDRKVHVRNLKAKESRLRHINLDNLDPNAQDGSQFARRSNVIYDEQLTINGNLYVKRINGIDIKHLVDSLFSRSQDQVISWPTIFNGSLSVDSATTTTINGLSVPSDLVRINGSEQVITGRKVFERVTLEANSELIMQGNILNGKNLNSLDIIKNDPSMKKDCHGHKKFSSVHVLGNIIANTVNGLNLERDVMLTNRPQNVSGKLMFTSDVRAYQLSFPDGVQVRTINDIPVDEALDGLVRHDDQSVTLENKDFLGGIVADEIDLQGTVNGVDLITLGSSVIRLDSPQAIYTPLKFEDEVTFDKPIDTRSVNGQNLQKEFMDLLDERSRSNEGIKIIGNVRVDGDVITGLLNGHPADKYKEMVIQANDNRFNRPVIFESNVTIDHLTISNEATLDGIFPFDLIQLDKPIHLKQSMRVRGNARIDDKLIVRSGIVNNCSLNDIASLTEYRNRSQPIHFQHPIEFNQVNILGNLRLINGKINDINLDQLGSQAQIIAKRDQRFNSSFTFADDVHVDELFIDGPINGVNLRELYADSVRQSAGYQRIYGRKTFKSIRINNGEVTFNGNVSLRGTINGVNVTKLFNECIRSGDYNVVRGIKILNSNEPIVLHDIETPLLGGVNMGELASTTASETINADTTFSGPVEIDNLVTRGHHGRQLNTQKSSVQFMGPVNVKQLNVKRINGIPIENFVSTLRDTQLNGSYTINQIHVLGDLMMDPKSTINGVDLPAIRDRSIDIRSSNFIPGIIILDGGANFNQGIELTNDSMIGNKTEERARRSLISTTNALEMELRQIETSLQHQTMRLAQAVATIDMDEKEFDSFDIIDYFNDFDIATDHIKRISISKDYRRINGTKPFHYNQGLTRSVYLGYDQSNKCDQSTSIFDIVPTDKQSLLKDRAINENGKYFAPITYPLGNGASISVSGWTNLPDCRFNSSFASQFRSSVTFYYQTSNYTIHFGPNEAFSEVKYFLDNGRVVLITLRSLKAGEQSRSTINVHDCYPINQAGIECPISHELAVPDAISMDFIDSKVLQTKIVAIMTHPRADCIVRDPIVSIFAWNPMNRHFYRSGSISAPNPVMMKFIEYPQRNLSTIIIANNRDTGICAQNKVITSSSVNIFRLDSIGQITSTPYQLIDMNVNAISSFSVDHQAYLVLGSKSTETTNIYRLERINKFEAYQVHITKGIEDVKCFWSSSDQLLMVITTTDHHKAVLYQAIFV